MKQARYGRVFDLQATVEKSLTAHSKLKALKEDLGGPEPFPALPIHLPFLESIMGSPILNEIVSPYTGRRLKPYIRRDFEFSCAHLNVLNALKEKFHSSAIDQTGVEEEAFHQEWTFSCLDYEYFSSRHLTQVNSMLANCFWQGIDVSEALQYPDYGIVAVYRQLVVGVALGNPEGYVSYIAVLPGWNGSGIASFMLYWLCKVLVHCSLHIRMFRNSIISFVRSLWITMY
jgi:hypothetical protein